MTRKMLVKVHSMNDQKSRSKALQIVARFYGVESISLKGEEKNQIEVIGEDIDAVAITRLLRNKLGSTELVVVAPVVVAPVEEENESNIVQLPLGWYSSTNPYGTSVPHYSVHQLNNYI